MTEITGQPAYQQIAHDLRRKIADEVYRIGEPIPAVVRAAIKELQVEGILIGQPGKGVYVQHKPTDDELARNADTPGRIAELEAAVRELSARLEGDVTSDIAEIRRQVGVMQSQIMELYGRLGCRTSTTRPRSPRTLGDRSPALMR
ncbi:hypothetical protein [Dactylosporangium sp. NPDC048998]|uniref:hypothetical protein n=1 Tax=Dactylosporangium sp. NPDC048998 TaxID=3363976 RepID=UPI00371B1554